MSRMQKLIEAANANRQVNAEASAARLNKLGLSNPAYSHLIGAEVRVDQSNGEAVDGSLKVRVVSRTNRASHKNVTAGQFLFYVDGKKVTKEVFAEAAR